MVRVNELLKRAISEVLHSDFRTESVHITIMKVDTAPNLKGARVHFSVYDKNLKDNSIAFLKKVKGHLQSKVGDLVHMKNTPSLVFIFDDSAEKINKTLSIIDSLEDADKE